jgi:hypothetical protein
MGPQTFTNLILVIGTLQSLSPELTPKPIPRAYIGFRFRVSGLGFGFRV